MKKKYMLNFKIFPLFLLVLVLSSCNSYHTPDSTKAESQPASTRLTIEPESSSQTPDLTEENLNTISESNLISELSEDHMLKTITEISKLPRPIHSEQIKEVALYLENSFKNIGYADLERQIFEYNNKNNEYALRRSSQLDIYLAPTADKSNADGTGTNIIVTKTAKEETEKTLILSAHYDSTADSNGANDNGSGIAIVLELARIIEKIDLPYNVKFILFSGEEKFMLGSRWYINTLSEKEKQNIIGLINIDTVAEKSDLGYLVMIYGNQKLENNKYTPEDFVKMAELNKNSISNLFADNDRFMLTMAINSDHYPFALSSIPAVSIVQDWQEGLNANSSEDTLDQIDTSRLIEVASKVIQALYSVSY